MLIGGTSGMLLIGCPYVSPPTRPPSLMAGFTSASPPVHLDRYVYTDAVSLLRSIFCPRILPIHPSSLPPPRNVTIGMTCLTIFVLWGDDIRLFLLPKVVDDYFYGLVSLAMIIFCCEFLANNVAKENYKGGFFFWLDMVATASLMFDIKWVFEFVENYILNSSEEDEDSTSSLTSSVGAVRTARAVRLVRLIRLVRVVKLWSMVKRAKQAENEERLNAQARTAANAKQAALKRVEASRLGKLLSESTTRKVVLMMLAMLFVIPFLDANTHLTSRDNSKIWGLALLFWFARTNCGVLTAAGKTAVTGEAAEVVGGSGAGANSTTTTSTSSSTAAAVLEDPTCVSTTSEGSAPWVDIDGWKQLVITYSQVSRDRGDREPGISDIWLSAEFLESPLLWLRIPNFALGGRLTDILEISSGRTTIGGDVAGGI